MKGTLYGIGVGPGDWELMTLKAVKMIEKCPVIFVPGENKEDCVAYQIASKAVDLTKKECFAIAMPMIKDPQKLEQYHEQGSKRIETVLASGRDAAFLTLGDPTIYSTYTYLHKRIREKGYKTEIISGVPSFCAAAARLQIPLVEGSQQMHLIPASYQTKQALDLSGTKVFMKAGKSMAQLKEQLSLRDAEIYMVENCGMDRERVAYCAEEISGTLGYYSIVLMKEKEEAESEKTEGLSGRNRNGNVSGDDH